MKLYNTELEKQVHTLFEELKVRSNEIVSEERIRINATEKIMKLVYNKILVATESYMVDVYAFFVEKIKNPENLNAFYRLNLRDKLNKMYRFNIQNSNVYKKKIEYKDISLLRTTASLTVGALVMGEILKFALSKIIDISQVVVIEGTVVVALSSYFMIPLRNRNEYKKAIYKFLNDLENDVFGWLYNVEGYIDKQVKTLYK